MPDDQAYLIAEQPECRVNERGFQSAAELLCLVLVPSSLVVDLSTISLFSD